MANDLDSDTSLGNGFINSTTARPRNNKTDSGVIFKKLREDEIAELREIFNLVDEDRGGTISDDELRRLLKTVGIQATETEIDKMVTEMMDDVDANGDGEISVRYLISFILFIAETFIFFVYCTFMFSYIDDIV